MESRLEQVDANIKGLNYVDSWELLSREKLKMLKPGEKSFRFYDKESK